jgi:intein/homing endonuclease
MRGKWRERQKAIHLRQQGKSVKQITKLLKISRSSASIWVREVKLSQKQKANLKERELKGGMKGLKKVHKKWKEYHKLHPKIEKGPRWPKRSVENFFDTWTPEMAYVLGFFAADGCMYKNKRGSYYIGFTSTDSQLIRIVKRLMAATNKIEEYQPLGKNRQRKYVLQIGSRKIYQRLLKLGFTERKSLTLKFPNIPDEFAGAFTRGYFDGDGCAFFGRYKRNDTKKYRYILLASFISGSQKFLVDLQKKLKALVPMQSGAINPHGRNAYSLAYSIHSARQLYNFMYPTTTVPHLGRKKTKFEEAFAKMDP